MKWKKAPNLGFQKLRVVFFKSLLLLYRESSDLKILTIDTTNLAFVDNICTKNQKQLFFYLFEAKPGGP